MDFAVATVRRYADASVTTLAVAADLAICAVHFFRAAKSSTTVTFAGVAVITFLARLDDAVSAERKECDLTRNTAVRTLQTV